MWKLTKRAYFSRRMVVQMTNPNYKKAFLIKIFYNGMATKI